MGIIEAMTSESQKKLAEALSKIDYNKASDPDWEKKLAALKAQMLVPNTQSSQEPSPLLWVAFFMSFLSLLISVLAYFK